MLLAAVVVVAVGLLGLPTPAADAQLFGISEQQEIQIGREAERQLSQQPGFVDDPAQTAYVRDLGLQLAHVSERPGLPWTYHIVKDDSANAFAVPGGFIFVTRGLLGFVKSKDELAFVLGHETTHVAHRHAVDLAQKDMELQLGALVVTQILFGGNLGAYELSQLGRSLIDAKYSREKEAEADHYGVIYMRKVGYDPHAALTFFQRLEASEKSQPGVFQHAFEDHPDTPARLAAIQVELRQMGYDDVPAPVTAPARFSAPPPSGPTSGPGEQSR